MYTISAINGSSTVVIHENNPDSLVRLSAGKFSDEVNAIPCFQFDIPASNPEYDELHDRTTIISVHNDVTGEIDFEGPLIHSVENVTAAGKVYKSCSCEGYLTYLNDSIQQYHTYENTSAADFLLALLTYHNSVTPEGKHITSTCSITGDTSNSKTTSYRNTLEEIKVNLIERLGGEIKIIKVNGALTLNYADKHGVTSSTTIELAKNIYSINVDTDTSNIVTRLVPLGAQVSDETSERLTISSVNSGLPYIDDATAIAKYGIIMGTVIFDDITVAANLLQRGQDYLTNNNRVKKGYAAQVLDLSLIEDHTTYAPFTIKAGNTYRFKHSVIGLDEDLRVMKCTVDIFKPYKPDVQIGDKAETITSIATQTASLIEYELPKQRIDILASAKATATALINAGINGYVVVNGNEILIMDTPDKGTANNVWRWNSGGFGYSSNGYGGPYDAAITMDGKIHAEFITAGVLSGLEINNGNGTFHVDVNGAVTAQAIDITGGSINIQTNSETFDVIALSHFSQQHSTMWSYTVSPLEWEIKNTAINRSILCQAGALYFYNGSTIVASIDSDTGAIVTNGIIATQADIQCNGNTYCGNVMLSNGQGAFTSLRSELDALWAAVGV